MGSVFASSRIAGTTGGFLSSFTCTVKRITNSFTEVKLAVTRGVVNKVRGFLGRGAREVGGCLVSVFGVNSRVSGVTKGLTITFTSIFSIFNKRATRRVATSLVKVFTRVKVILARATTGLNESVLGVVTRPFVSGGSVLGSTVRNDLKMVRAMADKILAIIRGLDSTVSELCSRRMGPFFSSVTGKLSDVFKALVAKCGACILPMLRKLTRRFGKLLRKPLKSTVLGVRTFLKGLVSSLGLL